MLWASTVSMMLPWVVWLPLLVYAEAFGSVCPSWDDNPWCPCYSNDEGIYMECPMVSLGTIASVLGLVQDSIKSLNIYDLDMNVTTLPAGIFRQSAGVSSLQISHSNIMSIADSSFYGLESSLETLTIKHCKLSTIPQIALHKLTRLDTLDLQTNNITELPSFAFSKMKIRNLNFKGNMVNLVSDFAFDSLEETLEELNLISNDLKELPINALKNIKSLKKIEVAWNHITDFSTEGTSFSALQYFDLSSNKVRKVRGNSLAGMPGLVSLSLYMNSISMVARDAFKENSKLETVFLGHNGILELDPKTFTHTPKIKVIDLGSNNIQSINSGVFSHLPELQDLILSNNNIREITKDAFAGSTSIRVLNLEHNTIRFIEPETFKVLEAMEILLLSHNNIQEIYPFLFSFNLNLKVLKFDHNGITDVDELTFKNTSQLTELFLQKNKITGIGQGLFSRLMDLRELHIHGNNIRIIPDGVFSNNHKLEDLSLQGNEIFALSDTLNHDSKTLKYLRLSENSISTLHLEAFRGQTQLDILWLDNNNISEIVRGLFHDLSYVRQLHLQKNLIEIIEERAFANMSSLQKLCISDNILSEINGETFYGLSSVRELYLDNNAFKDITPNAFQWMIQLEKLVLSGNALSKIKKDLFVTELPIKELSLDNAQISEIEDGALETLSYLEILNLRGNNLQELHAGFLRLTQLYALDISDNKFLSLDINSLTGLSNLENLDMSLCGIDVLPDKFFDSSMSLKYLNIAGNKIRHLRPATMSGLLDLISLDVSDNELTMDSCKSFIATRNLEKLIISNNPIITLCPSLGQLKGLKELYASNILLIEAEMTTLEKLRYLNTLDISNNMLTDIPTGSFQSSSIRELNLARNLLQQLPTALFTDVMGELQVLNVSNNPLKRVVASSVDKSLTLKNLERLEISQTNLTVITSLEFAHMPGLRSLNLQNGSIFKISPGAFRSLSQLTQLDLGYNMLEILPRERLRGLNTLSNLNLTRNRIKKLDQFPSDAQNLKVLDASGNMLTELDENVFKHTPGLEELLLGDNWITSIHPEAFVPLSSVKVLDLSHNNLEILRPPILAPIERTLEAIELDGNPITCGCETVELWTWLHNHPAQVKHPHAVICDLPETLRSQSFLHLSASAFCPQPLILRLAIQDIQSQSLLVSWQAMNSSAVYGFKVTYQALDEEENSGIKEERHLESIQTSPTLALSSRTYILEELRPSTEYQVCVHGLTKSIGLARAHTLAPIYNIQQAEGARCTRGQTLAVPPSPATGTFGGRVGLILGITLAVALLLGVIITIVWYRVCRGQTLRGQEQMKRPNGAPPDYYSHFQGRRSNVDDDDDDDDEFAC
ncbi:hypothetical protein SK128_027135 [Halocaridina rubra]|uniref:Fibronectin type-III domain-containing protein n=1 Tax=Halocaridina rubra TaxID=373956 RepID=A0AAN8XTH8_HALRR